MYTSEGEKRVGKENEDEQREVKGKKHVGIQNRFTNFNQTRK